MLELFGYQEFCVNYIKKNFGLILYHSMGSGKTITSLAMAIQFTNDIVIVATKTSRKNFQDDIQKMIKLGMKIDQTKITIFTYQKAISSIKDKQLDFNNKIIIIDEAHRLRNVSKLTSILISECFNAHKLILLTGTIFYNGLSDLSVLVNMIKKSDVLPETSKEFKFFYYDETYQIPTNIDDFIEKIKGTISYYKKSLDEHYPTSETIIKKVDMSNEQITEYRFYVKKILSLDNIQHIDYSVMDKRKVNFFLNVTRQLSNTVENSPNSPKIKAIFEYIKSNPKPAIVYSNFLNNGVLPLSILLAKANIKYGTYHGEQTEEKRNKIIDNYNSGLIDVLLITTAGSESLDLKNTRQIHIMELHWNESKINQIIGRAIRYKSHDTLKPTDRNVKIIKWISVFGYKIPYETADEYLEKIAEKKDKMFEQFNEIIKATSV
jgi:superfamily II DNA or RNA helicase